MKWKSRSTPLPAALCPRIGCLWPSTASQISSISRRLASWRRYLRRANQLLQRDVCADTQSVVASVGPPRSAMSLVAALQVPRQVSARLQAVCFPRSSTVIRSLDWRSLHQSLVARTAVDLIRKASLTCASSLVALSKVSRDTWQK